MSIRDKLTGLDPDAIAYREYDCQMPDGTDATIAVSLGNLLQPGVAAAAARERGAVAVGQIAVQGARGVPSRPIPWIVAIAIARDDPAVDDELRALLVRVLQLFFRDIRDVAPDPAELRRLARR